MCWTAGDRNLPCFSSIIDLVLLKVMKSNMRYEPERRQSQKAQSLYFIHYLAKITFRDLRKLPQIKS